MAVGGIRQVDCSKLSVPQRNLLGMAMEATYKAHSPKSNFFVGAALLTDDGSVFTGGNCGNAETAVSMCAERSAVAKAVAAGKTRFTDIAITARFGNDGTAKATPPCALCRQVLFELPEAHGTGLNVIYSSSDFLEIFIGDIRNLLPGAFSPFNLRTEEQLLPYISSPRTTHAPGGNLSVVNGFPNEIASLLVNIDSLGKPARALMQEALHAMSFSYSPYGKLPSGAALLSASGKVYRGALVENALSSANISALRAALAIAVSEGEREFLAAAVVSGKEGAGKQNLMPLGGMELQALSQFSQNGRQLQILLATSAQDLVLQASMRELLPLTLGLEHYKIT